MVDADKFHLTTDEDGFVVSFLSNGTEFRITKTELGIAVMECSNSGSLLVKPRSGNAVEIISGKI